MVLMVLSEDYTPKSMVAEGRPYSIVIGDRPGGYRGFFPPPSGNSRWGVSRIREKVAYLPPRPRAGQGSVLVTFGYPLSIGSINLSESLRLRNLACLLLLSGDCRSKDPVRHFFPMSLNPSH